jgi:hypothetical protein
MYFFSVSSLLLQFQDHHDETERGEAVISQPLYVRSIMDKVLFYSTNAGHVSPLAVLYPFH